MTTQFGFRSSYQSPARQRIDEAGRRYQEAIARQRMAALPKIECEPAKPKLSAWQIATGLDRVIHRICRKYGVTLADMLGGSRKRWPCMARAEAFLYMADNTGMSLSEIGRRLNKDASSVRFALAQREKKRYKNASE